MLPLVYGIVFLIIRLVILSIPACISFLAFILVKKAFKTNRIIGVACAVIALSPIIWLVCAWVEFSNTCQDISPPTQFKTIDVQNSILLRMDMSKYGIHKQINFPQIEKLPASHLECLEQEIPPRNYIERKCFYNDIPKWEKADYYKSNYAISVKAPSAFLGAGHMILYTVESINGSEIVARAEEAVFGTNVLFWYIGFFTESKNPGYLACGYVSKNINEWRGSSQNAYELYFNQDSGLMNAALGIPR